MSLQDRLRRDLGRRSQTVDRNELAFLVPSALVIVVVAQITDPGTPFDVALLAVGGLALVAFGLLPRVPMEALGLGVLVPVSVAIGHQGHLEVGFFLVSIMTLYTAWHIGSTVRTALIAGVAAAVILALSGATPGGLSWPPWVAAELFTWVLGRNFYRQRRLIEDLEAARTALADQAVADERQHIARELHDLAGHTLAAVLLHVTGARHVLRRDPDEADRAMADAETIGRASMDQIRATVAALRTTERGTDVAVPDADQLESLVAEYRRAGLAIDATIAPGVAAISGPVGMALHRIGREALANVARHAPANHVEVTVAVDRPSDRVRLQVCDHGRAAAAPDPLAGRYGLVGMRERARALGGTLEAAPTADGWRVDAVLPLVESVRVGDR